MLQRTVSGELPEPPEPSLLGGDAGNEAGMKLELECERPGIFSSETEFHSALLLGGLSAEETHDPIFKKKKKNHYSRETVDER